MLRLSLDNVPEMLTRAGDEFEDNQPLKELIRSAELIIFVRVSDVAIGAKMFASIDFGDRGRSSRHHDNSHETTALVCDGCRSQIRHSESLCEINWIAKHRLSKQFTNEMIGICIFLIIFLNQQVRSEEPVDDEERLSINDDDGSSNGDSFLQPPIFVVGLGKTGRSHRHRFNCPFSLFLLIVTIL